MSNNKDFKVKNGIQPTAYHEGLGTFTSGSVTVGYSISALSYDSKSGDVSSQIEYASGIAFKTDGTKMYVTSAAGTGSGDVFQYSLSTAWDVSTASYDSVSYSNGSVTNGYGLQFNDDGTKMFLQAYEDDRIYEHTLSTAWDLSTASYNNNNLYYGSQTAVSYDFVIGSNGTKLYVNNNNDYMYQYTMTTAYDLSTASYDSVSFDATTWTSGDGWHTQFNADGTRMIGVSEDDIYQFSLSTAWDISTLSFDNVSNVGGLTANVFTGSFVLKTDGTKLYQTRLGNVYQYTFGSTTTTNTLDLSTGSVFEITPTSDIQIGLSNPAASGTVSQATLLLDGANTNTFDLSVAEQEASFSVSSQSTLPQGLFFKSDGTKMYVADGSNRDVFQYSLSTAWDVSTASYDSVFADFGSQDTDVRGIFFKDDGTKFYLCGDAGNDVNEYSLSTAWDISTRSFTTNFSVSSQDTEPQGIYFKPDGTKFYIAGANSSDIYQYSLSTAWDISTASYESKSLNVSSQDGVVQDIWLNSDGTKAFVLGGANDAMYQYSLSTAYDISTASYDSVTYALSSVDTSVEGLFFKADGDKFYFVGGSTDKVYQYSCASSATITYDSTLQWGGGTAPDSPAANETDVLTFSTRDGGTTYQAAIAIDGAA